MKLVQPQQAAKRTGADSGKAYTNPLQLLRPTPAPTTDQPPALESIDAHTPAPSASVAQRSVLGSIGFGLGMATGIGAIGYGLYRYYRHRRRENTLNDIDREQADLDVTHINDVDGLAYARANNPNAAQADRTYNTDLNRADPLGFGRTSPQLIELALLHERTHMTADRAYSINDAVSQGEVYHRDPTNPNHQQEQQDAIVNRVVALDGIIQADTALTDQQRREMTDRVGYAYRIAKEYDPVINELLSYSRAFGIRANSRTVKALVVLARENLERRRPNGPHLQNASPV